MTQEPLFAGLVLAGGRGERLGGCDKGLLLLEGEPFARHLVRALATRLDAIAISANQALDQYQAMADAVLPDRFFPEQGPLAGLCEGLHWARSHGCTGILVTSCDTPRLSPQWVARLVDGARDEPGRARLTRLESGEQPLHGYYPVDALAALEKALGCGERRARRFAASLSPIWVDCEDLAADFFNVNEPDDLKKL